MDAVERVGVPDLLSKASGVLEGRLGTAWLEELELELDASGLDELELEELKVKFEGGPNAAAEEPELDELVEAGSGAAERGSWSGGGSGGPSSSSLSLELR